MKARSVLFGHGHRTPRDRPDFQIATLADGGSHGFYGDTGSVKHIVERLNHRLRASLRSDIQDYVNGDAYFLFDHFGQFLCASNSVMDRVCIPDDVSTCARHRDAGIVAQRKFWSEWADHRASDCFVVCGWNQKPVLIDVAQIVNKPERFVPTTVTVWAESEQRQKESKRNSVGVSLSKGCLKVFSFLLEGELDFCRFVAGPEMWSHYLPIRVIKSASHIEDGVACDDGRIVYDGLVSFCERGALSGYVVCFKDIGEGLVFAEKFGKFRDVFHCSIEF